MYILLYLVSIVLANLAIYYYGPSVAIYTAFLFIGLDLTTRDKLHDKWKQDKLVLKMGALIIAGSVLSYIINRNVQQLKLED